MGLFLLLVRAGTNSCCKCGTVRLQTHFFRVRSHLKGFSSSECPVFRKLRSCLCRRASRSVSRSRQSSTPSVRSFPPTRASLCAVRATGSLRADSIGSCVPGQQASGSASCTRCRASRQDRCRIYLFIYLLIYFYFFSALAGSVRFCRHCFLCLGVGRQCATLPPLIL